MGRRRSRTPSRSSSSIPSTCRRTSRTSGRRRSCARRSTMAAWRCLASWLSWLSPRSRAPSRRWGAWASRLTPARSWRRSRRATRDCPSFRACSNPTRLDLSASAVLLPYGVGCMHEAPAIQSARHIRADAGDAARVSLFLGRVVFARTQFLYILVRLPSILLGYSDSSDTTCHVHASAICVCILLVLRVLSEGGGTSPSSDVRHIIFSCSFVLSSRSNKCRGTVFCRGQLVLRSTEHHAEWQFTHSLKLCRRFHVDCIVFVRIIGSTRSVSLIRGRKSFLHGGKCFRAVETWSNSRRLLQ